MRPVPSPDQIVAMAPDASAVKAGRELATPRRWSGLGRDAELLWGLAQGSSKDPYQVQVLLAEPAFRCTCPSRKFPCKHGLGLLLLASEQAALLPAGARPAFVDEWLQSRAQRAEQQQARAERKAAGAQPDEAAQARRRERRATRIEDGAALLQQWLHDLVRGGFAEPHVQTTAFWRDIAQRLVDAQAPGLAARLRRIGDTLAAGLDRALPAMDELGRVQTLLAALARQAELPPVLRSSLLQAVGVPIASDAVLAERGIADDWFVAGQTVVEQDQLLSSTTWLRGRASERWACLLQTAPVHQRAAELLPLGALARGELAFHPGPAPLRALFRSAPHLLATPAAPPVEPFAALLQRHADALALEPWRRHTPFVANAQPATCAGTTVLVDDAGDALPWSPRPATATLLESLTGGRTVPIAGTWDGQVLDALAAQSGSDWIDLGVRSAAVLGGGIA